MNTTAKTESPAPDAEQTPGKIVPMPGRGEKEAPYIEAAEALIAGRQSAEPAKLIAVRERALNAFRAAGFPHRRVEAWKYTDLAAALPKEQQAETEPATQQPVYAGLPSLSVEFGAYGVATDLPSPVDGLEAIHYTGQDDDVPGWALDLLDALSDETGWQTRPVAALALAGARDVIGLRVKAGGRPSAPLSLLYGKDGASTAATAVLIDVEDGAELTLVEDHLAAGFSTHYLLLRIGNGARVSHCKTFQGQANAPVMTLSDILCAENADYKAFYLTFGGGLARNELRVALKGEGALAELNGANLLADSDHGDTTVIIDHAAPNCTSSQSFKWVLNDRARGVFQGKVIVDRDAQHTDARQMSKALLLSPRAEMDTKPELEIYADDVKCTHGATAGQLDAEALFYLRSRGIPLAQATQLLIAAFIGELLDIVENETVAQRLRAAVEDWLTGKTLPLAEDKKSA